MYVRYDFTKALTLPTTDKAGLILHPNFIRMWNSLHILYHNDFLIMIMIFSNNIIIIFNNDFLNI